MLTELLDKHQGFKLVCGAGNEDIEEVEKLTYIYSLAGANFNLNKAYTLNSQDQCS